MPTPKTKSALVLRAVSRARGATIPEMMERFQITGGALSIIITRHRAAGHAIKTEHDARWNRLGHKPRPTRYRLTPAT
jgi:hypothetical protein